MSSTTHPATTYTAEDLLALSESQDATRYELVAGQLRVMEPAGAAHGLIEVRLLAMLFAHVQPRGLGALFAGDTGFVLRHDPDTVRAPDVAFVRADRLPMEGLDSDAGYLELAPDLAAEVASPSDTVKELGEKVSEYLDVGVRLVWVVDPANRTVTTYGADRSARLLTENDTLDGGDVVPGFRCAVADLFQGVRRR